MTKIENDDSDQAETAERAANGLLELVVLSVKETAARCRLLGSEAVITLRTGRLWDIVPGEIALVRPRKQWSYAGHPYMSGEVEATRLDAAALALVPLRIEKRGIWSPAELDWDAAAQPIPKWAQSIIARGPRPEFEMEQVLPADAPLDIDTDPILEANDLKDAGGRREAVRILMDLCDKDLRCLDAHAHLGNLVFEHRPQDALPHFAVGVRLDELALGPDFDGLLPWAFIENRPFLRCLHGQGLCLWRLERFGDASRVFERLLWLNPRDNQGARLLIEAVTSQRAWRDGA
jgi:hypothetical protein